MDHDELVGFCWREGIHVPTEKTVDEIVDWLLAQE